MPTRPVQLATVGEDGAPGGQVDFRRSFFNPKMLLIPPVVTFIHTPYQAYRTIVTEVFIISSLLSPSFSPWRTFHRENMAQIWLFETWSFVELRGTLCLWGRLDRCGQWQGVPYYLMNKRTMKK